MNSNFSVAPSICDTDVMPNTQPGKILVTGAAGFIGAALSERLLELGHSVIGIDNLNDYYDVSLKKDRLKRLIPYGNFHFEELDIVHQEKISRLFASQSPSHVVNLAAQVGVRYSLKNPRAYVDANIVGFLNILEGCRNQGVTHLVYASSSSVYGANAKLPFSVGDNVDHPISLYAATKKSNELMAHSYSHLYGLPTTGLRFFTVYGPWGRPDMAPFLFTRNILAGNPINVFNFGKHRRDFTYIDDIVEGIIRVLGTPAADQTWSKTSPHPATSRAPYRLYNIGNNRPVELGDYIRFLEEAIGKKAKKNLLPLQKGDVADTVADIDNLVKDFDYCPRTPVETGVRRFVAWYREYYAIPPRQLT
uniref:UDP-glucuronate 4-epimerase n=1 Tax=Candidatus Kentrum sp. MB TaxID=2138164 RepID=A0A451BG74_9GAMM|nr:MAG: UDP-glucuronate 4-epimerase [Candidatus Kentron sp. MB]VFK35477.1 MAG: UDP-glucuronate 4-epimerase [Candidatus Kentron sp. MB]VFK77289.1 MAG: UDP-glucuronate 4-epimerase [Candidatus Kentron sp. MB]